MTRIVPVETEASGHGATRDAAVNDALANAVAQETGVTVDRTTAHADVSTQGKVDVAGHGKRQSTEQDQAAAATVKSVAVTDDQDKESLLPSDAGKTHGAAVGAVEAGAATGATTKTEDIHIQAASNESQQIGASPTAAVSGGKVKSYTVLSLDPAPDGGFDARVHAVLEITRRAGGVTDTRRRITVAPFTGSGDAGPLRDRLVMDLTQSRRFAVLDRSNDADYWQEMQTIAQSGTTEDEARIAKVAGVDYILSGKLAVTAAKTTGHAALTTYETQDLTGEVVSHTTASTLHTTAGAAGADFELIEVATRQVVMADHLQVSGANMDVVAARISDDIIEAIYPPRLVSIADPGALVINEGGSGMQQGKRLRLMQAGDEMFDPYTHESLGRTEREVGVIEVTEVQQRVSYAKLVSGQLPTSADAARLRPLMAPVPTPAAGAAAKPATVKPAALRKKAKAAAQPAAESDDGGGVKLPFDK